MLVDGLSVDMELTDGYLADEISRRGVMSRARPGHRKDQLIRDE
jgi:hypothetical protein